MSAEVKPMQSQQALVKFNNRLHATIQEAMDDGVEIEPMLGIMQVAISSIALQFAQEELSRTD